MNANTAAAPTASALVLVPGHWLGAWAWDAVTDDLRGRGLTVDALTLPGQDPDDPDRARATLEDQAEAIATAVAAATGDRRPILVAHSGAGVPVSVVLDRDPGCVRRVVYVDSGPSADGALLDPDVPADLTELPLPPFEELPASLDGVDDDARQRFRDRAVPVPGPVVTQPPRLHDEARRSVPTTMICCSFSAEEITQMARAGVPMMAETATLTDLTLIDLPTGHWPMWSRPADLADVLAGLAGG